MTSTPSVAFPAMEVPALDDSMEMASPYQGHADDFDIDIDIMEDQASNADRDMTAVDEYIESIDGTDYNQEGTKDADMIDDAESVMIDAEDHYQENDYNMEMKDEEKSYEADMLEDDYDEDIDVPVSEQQEEPAPPVQREHDQHPAPPIATDVEIEEIEKPAETTQPEILVEHVDEPSVEVNQRQEQAGDPKEFGSAAQGVDAPASWHAEENRDGTNADNQEGPQEAWRGGSIDHVASTKDSQNADSTEAEGSNLVQKTEEQEVVQENEEEEKAPAPREAEAQNERESAPQPSTTGDSSLYPIKVYYQDNEISLFPPREGDTSETFFLEDESLAHGPFAKLFESCREVLNDHIGDNEVLVMDVDAMNLQLNEDSYDTSKVTLNQIVHLYLQLCHNDGIDEPEALYLTLSTRLTIAGAMSDLLLAASEGKGLSEIHSWDEYNETDAAEADFPEQVQESASEQPTQHTTEQQESPSEAHDASDAESHAQAQKHTDTQGEVQEENREERQEEHQEEHEEEHQEEHEEEPQEEPQEEHQEEHQEEYEEEHEKEHVEEHGEDHQVKYQEEHKEEDHEEDHEEDQEAHQEADGIDNSASLDQEAPSMPTEVAADGDRGDREYGETSPPGIENDEQSHRSQEESYASEGQEVASVAAVDQQPLSESKEEQQPAGESMHIAGDAQHSSEAQQDHAKEGAETEWYPEEGDLDATAPSNDTAENGRDDLDETHESDAPGNVETSPEHAQQDSAQHDEYEEERGSQYHEDVSEQTLQGDDDDEFHQELQSVVDEVQSEPPQNNALPTPDVGGESVGRTEGTLEDSAQSPAKDEESDESGEVHEEPERQSPDAGLEHAEDLAFGAGDEYLDLDIPEEDFVFGDEETGTSQGQGTTKRDREPDDEFGLEEGPSPDAKRRRSS